MFRPGPSLRCGDGNYFHLSFHSLLNASIVPHYCRIEGFGMWVLFSAFDNLLSGAALMTSDWYAYCFAAETVIRCRSERTLTMWQWRLQGAPWEKKDWPHRWTLVGFTRRLCLPMIWLGLIFLYFIHFRGFGPIFCCAKNYARNE